jgi:type III secretion protein T
MTPLPSAKTLSDIIELSYPLLAGLPRFGAAFLILPLLAKTTAPRQIRIGFLIVMVAVAYPNLAFSFSNIDWNMGDWMLFILKEMLIGGLIGYSMGLILWILTAVGELIDLQAGMTNSQIFNPFGQKESGPFSVLLTQIGVLLFVGFGGMHVFLQLLYESLVLWPPSSFLPDVSNAFKDFSLVTSGSLLETAVRLASPVIAVLLIVEMGIGLVNRAATQINAFYFSMPIKAVTALLMLALLLTHMVDVVRQSFEQSSSLLPVLDKALRSK